MSDRQILIIMGVLLAWFWGMVAMVVWHVARPEPKRYDCSMAEFHPDFPQKVREQCRLIRGGARML